MLGHSSITLAAMHAMYLHKPTKEIAMAIDKSTINKIAFTEEEAAEYVSFSRSALRQSRMDGKREDRMPGPPWITVGNRSIRYLKKDLDEWIASFPKSNLSNTGEE